MNAHSVDGELSSEPFAKVIDERLIERIANTPIDDLHHRRAIERCAYGIDVQMQMRRRDAELEQDGAIGAGGIEQRALGAMMHRRKVRRFARRDIGDILDMRFPNAARVTAPTPI